MFVAASVLSAPAASAGGSARELRAFAGIYPFERVGGRSLLEVPAVRARIQMLLGRDGLNAINQFDVSLPAEERSGWLVAHGCKPHDCNEANWAIAINLADYSVFVCLGDKGKPVRYAATGRTVVEQPPKKESPCPDIPEALETFERVFASP